MSALQRNFFLEMRPQAQQRNKENKENNLSFRNIAANIQQQTQFKISPKHQNSKVDKSFHSIHPEQSTSSFYNSGDDVQQELNYVGSCFNHSSKLAEYFENISQRQYCKLCAAKLASLGYKLQRSQNFVSRDTSPILSRLRSNQQANLPRLSSNLRRQSTNMQQRLSSNMQQRLPSNMHQRPLQEVSQSRISPNLSISNIPPVKFSSIISHKNRHEGLQSKYEKNQRIVEEYMEIYAEKMELIEEVINDMRIKDTQYINKLKAQNTNTYQQATQQPDTQGYDMFGKSIFKEGSTSASTNERVKFRLPSEQRIQQLDMILQFIEKTTAPKQFSTNNIPLIKSVTSAESSGNANQGRKEILLKNSSSVSNLSSKSNFKKEKILNQNQQQFNSELSQIKPFKNQEENIESSRFSSNSTIIRKKNLQANIQQTTKTESTQLKRRKDTEISLGDSGSCQDTPESIKSKISSNSFVLPRNAVVNMFQKINVCESIDVKADEELKESKMIGLESNNREKKVDNNFPISGPNQPSNQSRYRNENPRKSAYIDKSGNKSNKQKGRKSFNRYTNIDNQS